MKLRNSMPTLSQIETLKNLFLTLILCFSVAGFANNQQPETTEDASFALENLQEDLNVLKYYAERIDLGRILVLEKRISQTNQIVKAKGLGNLVTLNSYQELVLSFKYSEAFMKAISTKMNQASVVTLKNKVDAIAKSRGFDQSMNSQLVSGILNQVYQLTQQLQGQQISENLIRWMKQDLAHKLGSAIASARANGDVPSSFTAANQIYTEVASHYNELYQINFKSPAYNMVTELMGLMEFYRDISTRGARQQETK